MSKEVLEPEGVEAKATHKKNLVKATHKKNLVKAKRIIIDSIKDHLIPHVSSLKKPKEVFDALKKLFKGNNINQNMTLRNQLKTVKVIELRDHAVLLHKGCSNQGTT